VERKGPGEDPGPSGKPPLGEEVLEVPGVGRVVADRTDEDDARAARMDDLIMWEAEEEVTRRAIDRLFFFLSTCLLGGLIPRVCAQRAAEGGGFPYRSYGGGRSWLPLVYISLRNEEPS